MISSTAPTISPVAARIRTADWRLEGCPAALRQANQARISSNTPELIAISCGQMPGSSPVWTAAA